MNTYDKGGKIRLTAAFADSMGAAADPGAVTLRLRSPRGAITVHTVTDGGVVKDSTGRYHFDLSITEPGVWTYKWAGRNGVESASESQFYARKGML